MNLEPVAIVAAARTPMGGFRGELAGAAVPELGGIAIRAAVERAGLQPGQMQEVLMGCVLPAGLGQAPAGQAGTRAQEPRLFTTAPVGAIKKMPEKTGRSVADVGLREINEAFAVVAVTAIHDLGLDPARVDPNGGACALGHPIGCSGARLIVTLLGAPRRSGGRRGIATLCPGGGEAAAVAVEMV